MRRAQAPWSMVSFANDASIPGARMDLQIRPATREDASFIAPLLNAAGEGMPLHFWIAKAQPGEDPWEIGRRAVQRDESGVSWRKVWIAEVSGAPAGVLRVYQQPTAPEPVSLADLPPLVRPIVELEAEAAGTGHVQFLSVAESLRGRGVGTALLRFAERWRGPRGMSLIVADSNASARRLYAGHGYTDAARRPVVTAEGWRAAGVDWILMRKA